MATIRGGNVKGKSVGQTKQAGYHDSAQIKKTMSPAYSRDDLGGAFAGSENEAKFSRSNRSTNVKSRKSKASAEKTPKV